MSFFLNNKRYVEEKKPDGTIEHREIMEYYLDSESDVQDLPGIDQIDETSSAFIPETGEAFVLNDQKDG